MHFLCNCLKISSGIFHLFLSFWGKNQDFMFFSRFLPVHTYARNIILRNAHTRVYNRSCHRYLGDEDSRDAISEFLMQGFMMPSFHS